MSFFPRIPKPKPSDEKISQADAVTETPDETIPDWDPLDPRWGFEAGADREEPAPEPPPKAEPKPKRKRDPRITLQLDDDVTLTLAQDFSISERGVFHNSMVAIKGEETATSEFVCGPLVVMAESNDENGTGHGKILEWTASSGHKHRWAMPSRLLHEPANTIAIQLEDAGLRVSTDRRGHDFLKRYIADCESSSRLICVTRTGWHHRTSGGYAYVLSETQSFGPGAKDVILQSDRIASAGTAPETAGTLADWQNKVARYAEGNYRIGLFMAAAFTGPLLEITAEPSGGLHMHGGSQSGKTTAMRAAASIWGQSTTEGVIKTWRATTNGLEGVAAKATDRCLFLDEISQANADEVGDIIYQIGNQAGKARAGRDGAARPIATWRLTYLSTGEKTVAAKMGEHGNAINAGQDVRLVNIPSDAGKDMGVFQELHGFENAAALATHLTRTTENTAYGTAARAFLDRLAHERATDPDGLVKRIADRRQVFLNKVLPKGADGQVISVARRFSLIAVAGEMAREYGVLPWEENEAFNAAAVGFKAWLKERGGIGAAEDRQAVLTVRRFLEAHEESRFKLLLSIKPSQQSSDEEVRAGREIVNRVGFRRETSDGWEFLILPEAWKHDVCKGLDPARAAAALHAAGFLDKGDGKHWPKRHRVPDIGLGRFYTVHSSILAGDSD
jgi:putative DNA primase/helicase